MKHWRVSEGDIVSAMEWALTNCGEDRSALVMAHKLLEQMAEHYAEYSESNERRQTQCEEYMTQIESQFVVSDDDPFGEAV